MPKSSIATFTPRPRISTSTVETATSVNMLSVTSRQSDSAGKSSAWSALATTAAKLGCASCAADTLTDITSVRSGRIC
jgi:hypothetical protein